MIVEENVQTNNQLSKHKLGFGIQSDIAEMNENDGKDGTDGKDGKIEQMKKINFVLICADPQEGVHEYLLYLSTANSIDLLGLVHLIPADRV